MDEGQLDADWVPESCTLPTVDRPVRSAAFDRMFAADVLSVRRDDPHRLRLELRPDPTVAARAAELAVRETECCSFFAFDLVIGDGAVWLQIETSATHEPVLAALGARAEARRGSTG